MSATLTTSGVILSDLAGEIEGTTTMNVHVNPARSNKAARGRRPAEPPPAFTRLIDCQQLLALDLRPKFIVKNVLVEGQPCVIGGRSKTLKTSVATDLEISLGTGTQFLGTFEAAQRKVAVWSGESGAGTLRETARRIAEAKGVTLTDASVLWCFDLPKLSRHDHLKLFHETIAQHGIQVAVVDPLYLSLLSAETAKSAGNLFAMGAALQPLTAIGQETGCTIVFLHHFRKTGVVDPDEPAALEELSQSGVAEWARQWVLLQRREKYQADGHHQLWMRCGGSAGHASLHALDVDEGVYDEDKPEGGRYWAPVVVPVGDARDAARKDRERKAAERAERQAGEDRRKMLEALRRLPQGETLRALREVAGLKNQRAADALRDLIGTGQAEQIDIEKNGREEVGYRPVDTRPVGPAVPGGDEPPLDPAEPAGVVPAM
jgi:hypothetical protein